MVRLMCVNECATRFAASEAEATAALCAALAEFWAISTADVRVVSLSGAPAMGRLEIVVGGAQIGLLRRAHICAGTRPASVPGLAHLCVGTRPTTASGDRVLLFSFEPAAAAECAQRLVVRCVQARCRVDQLCRHCSR